MKTHAKTGVFDAEERDEETSAIIRNLTDEVSSVDNDAFFEEHDSARIKVLWFEMAKGSAAKFVQIIT